jgi:hypothetical protein
MLPGEFPNVSSAARAPSARHRGGLFLCGRRSARGAYPVEDKAHARNAKARASQAAKAGRMSKAEEGKIDRKADAVLEKG